MKQLVRDGVAPSHVRGNTDWEISVIFSHATYPLVMTNVATENDHRNSEFSHEKWWFSIVMLVYQRDPEGISMYDITRKKMRRYHCHIILSCRMKGVNEKKCQNAHVFLHHCLRILNPYFGGKMFGNPSYWTTEARTQPLLLLRLLPRVRCSEKLFIWALKISCPAKYRMVMMFQHEFCQEQMR